MLEKTWILNRHQIEWILEWRVQLQEEIDDVLLSQGQSRGFSDEEVLKMTLRVLPGSSPHF
jgi:hypothetical protein